MVGGVTGREIHSAYEAANKTISLLTHIVRNTRFLCYGLVGRNLAHKLHTTHFQHPKIGVLSAEEAAHVYEPVGWSNA